MEIKDMRAFYAIVEEGNISHAAQRLDIAQPALSRQMKRLESSLGVQLFERGSRRIRLTDAGRVLYSRVEHILGMVDGTVREITEIGSGVAGSIQLGTITTSGALLLPELITEFHRRYPQVTYQIWEAEGARILELLDNRVIEIAITRTQVDSKVYESIVLPNEPLVVVMNKDQIIGSSDKEVRMEELRDTPIIISALAEPLRRKLPQARLRAAHRLRLGQHRTGSAARQDGHGRGHPARLLAHAADGRQPLLQEARGAGDEHAYRHRLAQEPHALFVERTPDQAVPGDVPQRAAGIR